ncbi:MAG: iron-sulfur cluster assembly scaffold protein [Bacillota bacterium]
MNRTKKDFDVVDIKGKKFLYSDKVEDHFFNPRNVLKDKADLSRFNATAKIGSPACGDVMKIYLAIDPKTERILDFKWKTFGCASAIASTSILSEMALGKTIDQAYKISARQIVEKLGGLPQKKIHCSVLGDQALRKAIDNFRKKVSRAK